MAPLEQLQQTLKKLPGLGYPLRGRSGSRCTSSWSTRRSWGNWSPRSRRPREAIHRCVRCGNLAEGLCAICADPRRDPRAVCVIEHVPDLVALERSGAWRGTYHVLHGRLSPRCITSGRPTSTWQPFFPAWSGSEVDELILALANDVEGEATCHYVTGHLPAGHAVKGLAHRLRPAERRRGALRRRRDPEERPRRAPELRLKGSSGPTFYFRLPPFAFPYAPTAHPRHLLRGRVARRGRHPRQRSSPIPENRIRYDGQCLTDRRARPRGPERHLPLFPLPQAALAGPLPARSRRRAATPSRPTCPGTGTSAACPRRWTIFPRSISPTTEGVSSAWRRTSSAFTPSSVRGPTSVPSGTAAASPAGF